MKIISCVRSPLGGRISSEMSSSQHRNPHQLFNKILHWSDTKHLKTSLQVHLNVSVWPRTGISFTHTKPHWSVCCLKPEARAGSHMGAAGPGVMAQTRVSKSHAAGSGACLHFTWRNKIKPFAHINQLRAWDTIDHKPQNTTKEQGPDPVLQLFKLSPWLCLNVLYK